MAIYTSFWFYYTQLYPVIDHNIYTFMVSVTPTQLKTQRGSSQPVPPAWQIFLTMIECPLTWSPINNIIGQRRQALLSPFFIPFNELVA